VGERGRRRSKRRRRRSRRREKSLQPKLEVNHLTPARAFQIKTI